MVHLLINGIRLKTVPSRLTVAHLQQLLTDGAHPASVPPIVTGDPTSSSGPIEVDRLVSSLGQVSLSGRQRPIGHHLAARRLILRLNGGVLQLIDNGILLRSLPNPLTPAEHVRLRDARPAGPPPIPATEPIQVERRVSCQGSLTVDGQRIQVGLPHAERTVTVEAADRTSASTTTANYSPKCRHHHKANRPIQSPQTRTATPGAVQKIV